MAHAFNEAGQMAASLVPYGNQNGQVIRQAKAHTTLTASTLYRIQYNEFGPLTQAIADDQDTYRVGIAPKATKTGEIAELVTGGPYSGLVTPSLSMAVGESLKVAGGAIADAAADFDDLHTNSFAVAYTATTSLALQDVIMVDEVITAT